VVGAPSSTACVQNHVQKNKKSENQGIIVFLIFRTFHVTRLLKKKKEEKSENKGRREGWEALWEGGSELICSEPEDGGSYQTTSSAETQERCQVASSAPTHGGVEKYVSLIVWESPCL
jgi:hypothetical protein